MERVWHSVRLIVASQRDVNIEAYQIREIRAVMELSEAAPKATVFDLDQLRNCQESLDDGTNKQTCVDALLWFDLCHLKIHWAAIEQDIDDELSAEELVGQFELVVH